MKSKILIVDDDLTEGWLLDQHLRAVGYEVFTATKGRAAIDQSKIEVLI